jgi:hypothetical protein
VLLVGAHSQISVAVLCLDAKVPIFAMVLFTGCRCLRGVFRPAGVRLGRCYRRSGQIRGTLASRLRTARRKWLLQAQLHAQSRASNRVESSEAPARHAGRCPRGCNGKGTTEGGEAQESLHRAGSSSSRCTCIGTVPFAWLPQVARAGATTGKHYGFLGVSDRFFSSAVSRRVQPASTSTKPVGRMVHAVTCHASAPWPLLGNYASCKSSSAASNNDSSQLVPDFSKLSTDASAQDKETMFLNRDEVADESLTDQIGHEQ